MTNDKINNLRNLASTATSLLQEEEEKAQEQARQLAEQAQRVQESNASKRHQEEALQAIGGGVYPDNIYNTYQFFDGELAKDVFNRNGNVINGEYRFLARRVAGLETQGNQAYFTPGNDAGGGASSRTGNSTGVGWTKTKEYNNMLSQKYWAWWVIQLATINKLSALATWNAKPALKIQLYKAYQVAILSGRSAIRKNGENSYSVFEVQEFNESKGTFKLYDASWFLNNDFSLLTDDDDLDQGEISFDDPNYVVLTWDLNGYNVWFYTVFYTLDFIDLQYAWLSRIFFERSILFQLQGSSDKNASNEMNQIANPSCRVIKVKTAGIELADNLVSTNNGAVVIGNKYSYTELGNVQDSAIFQTFPKLWLNLWDSVLGITPQNSKFDASRSLADEVAPQNDQLQLLQMKYGLTLDIFVEEFNKRFNESISVTLATPTDTVAGQEERSKDEADHTKPINSDE